MVMMEPRNEKVLVVGAGGIGCELLKDLVLSGFHNIEVVDLDTIELSNLNRQFLFRRQHIGKFKSEVAAEAVSTMNPSVFVKPHVGNIMDTKLFPFSFFQRFAIVLNALDNINARRYVNGICLAFRIPLIESGTAGYLGQCTVILPRKTECYDCTAKEAPKTFAVCTIRSTPSAPIHCVVWAKDYLLPYGRVIFRQVLQLGRNIFGEEQEESTPSDIDDSALLESLKKETEAFKRLREMAQERNPELGLAVFNKIFDDDIEIIRAIETLWETRPKPRSLKLKGMEALPTAEDLQQLSDQKVWTLEQWIALMFDALHRLSLRLPAIISFDKDDQDTLDLVASVANIRAHVYGIPMTSRFDLKALAGNIIPAIATTNAIAAAMIVIQAKNVLAGEVKSVTDHFITFDTTRTRYFVRSNLVDPSPECKICHVHRATLACDPTRFTLGQVIDQALPMFLDQLGDPNVTSECLSVLEGARMIYDEEDMPQSRSKTLKELGADDSKFLRFEFLEGLPLQLAVQKDGSHSVGEFTCTFDIIPQETVQLAAKRARPDDDDHENESDGLEIVEAESSDIEIIEPPAIRIKV